MATVIDNIGLLVTNDPTVGDGPLGLLRNASVVFDEDRIVSVGKSGQIADERIDAAGRCVIPGFVDSHTHLVFAGDRASEFAARMAGQPYSAGGIATTVAATRLASNEELARLTGLRRAEAYRAGITTIEMKSGYGLTTYDEHRCVEIASSFTEEITFLGAHSIPPEFAGRSDDYVHIVCNEMLAQVGPQAKWIDAFCEKGAFDADQCREVLRAGISAGLQGRLHANQLGFGPGVQLAVEMGCASADHCTYLNDDDIAALASGSTVATFLPIADFSTRQPYPNGRRVIDAGVNVALATNCNPGSSYSTAMSLCMALAVREMHFTIDEALQAATLGGAKALRRADIGAIRPGFRADLVVLDAPSHEHLVYRVGVPLIATVVEGGRTIG
jgi:imidazolonepropionase